MQPRRRFRFLKELSEGAFGKVYLAEMVTGEGFSSVVAIKLLHGKWAGHVEIVQRSRDEARVLGLLHHRNIIRVEDLTSINGQCAIVMEYLDGVDLKSLINFCRDNEIKIPLKVAFEVMAQTASALHAAYAHRPLRGGEPLEVIHRDIKPSNVMLTTAGEVKVLDFGTAQARFDEREAHTQALAFGSAAYMAPERLLGDPDTPFGDVFSLGVTLYELLSLESYGKINIRPEKFERRISDNLDKLELGDLAPERQEQVRTMLRLVLGYDPEDRPTAGQVVELLEALAEEIHDGSIRRFCREVVGPCRSTLEPKQNPDDPLTGSTLFEDTGTMMRALGQDGGGGETWIEDESVDGGPDDTFDDEDADPVFSLPTSGLAAQISGNPDLPPEHQHSASVKIGGPSVGPDAESVEGDAFEDEPETFPEIPDGTPSKQLAEDSVPAQAGLVGAGPIAEDSVPVAPQAEHSEPIAKQTPIAAPGRKEAPAARVPSSADTSESVEEESGGGGMVKLLLVALLLVVVGGGGIAAVVAGGLITTSATGGSDGSGTEDPATPDVPKDPVPKASRDALSAGEHSLDAGDSTIVLSLSDSGKGVVSFKGPQSKVNWDGTGELVLSAAEAGLWRGKVQTQGGSERATFDVPAGQRCSFRYDVASMPDEWEALGCE